MLNQNNQKMLRQTNQPEYEPLAYIVWHNVDLTLQYRVCTEFMLFRIF